MKATKCQCSLESPFLWKDWKRPSMFFNDPAFKPVKDGKSLSQVSSAQIQKSREEGTNAGYMRGISRDKEAEILRMRMFSVFTQAKIEPTGAADEQGAKRSDRSRTSSKTK